MSWLSFFLIFLYLKHSRQCIHFLSFDSYVNNQLGGIKIFVCYLLIQTHRHCQNRPCSNMPQAFGNDFTSAFLIKTTKYINMNSNIHVYHGKTHSPRRPRVKIDRCVEWRIWSDTHHVVAHVFIVPWVNAFINWLTCPDGHRGACKRLSFIIFVSIYIRSKLASLEKLKKNHNFTKNSFLACLT